MSTSESKAHLELKLFALAWAQEMGFRCAALEVRVPFSSFRADAAAYRPQTSPRSETPGETVIFECKQSRADLLRDSAAAAPALERLAYLHVRKKRLERLLKPHYPTLASGDSLFPEFESFDFSTLRHRGYQQTLREMRQLQSRVIKRIKFERMLKYPCANFHYLVVREGILAPHEWPDGWGVLERQKEKLTLMCRPIHCNASDAARLALLQKIALAGTRTWNRQFEQVLAKESHQN
jgi:hypothetical protein